jgi:uncharacterized protein GlcG (DUF336 family)
VRTRAVIHDASAVIAAEGGVMPDVAPGARLTHEGAMNVLQAAVARANELGVPQCIAVTDAAGRLLAFVRMDGSKFLSIRTSLRKAMTAASQRAPSGQATHAVDHGAADHAVRIGLVTGGRLTRLEGGIPIVVDGDLVGAVGVSSGSSEEDVAVAAAGVAAIDGAQRW